MTKSTAMPRTPSSAGTCVSDRGSTRAVGEGVPTAKAYRRAIVRKMFHPRSSTLFCAMRELSDAARLVPTRAELRARFDQDGCLLLRGLLDPDVVEDLRRRVLALH